MIAVVLDANCRDPNDILRGALFVDFVNDRDFDKNLSNLYDEINKRINLENGNNLQQLVEPNSSSSTIWEKDADVFTLSGHTGFVGSVCISSDGDDKFYGNED